MQPDHITPHVHPSRRHLIEPDAQLTDLGLDQIDLWDIRDTIERANNVEIADVDFAKWRSVADVAKVARELAA